MSLELARQCGIPAYFLSAESTSMTYSNATNERRSLIDFSLRPILTAIESRLSMDDFTPAGTRVRFDLDDFLRGNALERAQIYQILTGIGAMTVEEVRKAVARDCRAVRQAFRRELILSAGRLVPVDLRAKVGTGSLA